MDTHAFITINDGYTKTLTNDVVITAGERTTKAKALWDTGATNSCISERVVKELKPPLRGKTTMKTPSGEETANVYEVNILLPNKVNFEKTPVIESKIGNQGIDVLIGMDIIVNGDFAVSNFDGKTTFTFRVPSKKRTNFVKELQEERVCNHGKGKRKK